MSFVLGVEMLTRREAWIVDRNGQLWAHGDPRLAQQVGSRLDFGTLAQFAIENLGFVKLRYLGRSIRVICRPRIVTQQAFGTVCYALVERHWNTVGLSLLSQRWSHQVVGGAEQAMQLLTSLIPNGKELDGPPMVRLLSKAAPVDSFALGRMALSSIQGLDPSNIGMIDMDRLDRCFRGRWSVSHVDDDTGEFAFDFVGRGFTPLDPGWSGSSNFIPVSDFSDLSYRDWVASVRRDVLTRNQPLLDQVDAWVATPGHAMARLRYHRVMVPMGASGRRRYLLTASIADSSIDLRKAG